MVTLQRLKNMMQYLQCWPLWRLVASPYDTFVFTGNWQQEVDENRRNIEDTAGGKSSNAGGI